MKDERSGLWAFSAVGRAFNVLPSARRQFAVPLVTSRLKRQDVPNAIAAVIGNPHGGAVYKSVTFARIPCRRRRFSIYAHDQGVILFLNDHNNLLCFQRTSARWCNLLIHVTDIHIQASLIPLLTLYRLSV